MAISTYRATGHPGSTLWKSIFYEALTSPTPQILLLPPGEGKAYRIFDVLWTFNTDSFTYSELQNLNGSENGGDAGSGIRVPYGHTKFAAPITWETNKGIWSTGGNVTITYEIINV